MALTKAAISEVLQEEWRKRKPGDLSSKAQAWLHELYTAVDVGTDTAAKLRLELAETAKARDALEEKIREQKAEADGAIAQAEELRAQATDRGNAAAKADPVVKAAIAAATAHGRVVGVCTGPEAHSLRKDEKEQLALSHAVDAYMGRG